MIYKSLNRSSKEQENKENMEQENMEKKEQENMEQENMEKKTWSQYSNIPPQTHGGLRETILSLEVKTRKGLGERGLVKISASWS